MSAPDASLSRLASDRDGKGAPLRREGLYTSLTSAWRKQRDQVRRSHLKFTARRARCHLHHLPTTVGGGRGSGC